MPPLFGNSSTCYKEVSLKKYQMNQSISSRVDPQLVPADKNDTMIQTERDSHSIKYYKIPCWIYSIFRGSGFTFKFLWTELDLISAFDLKAVGSPLCYFTRMKGSQYIWIKIFPGSPFRFPFFLLNIYIICIKGLESSPCLRADSLLFCLLLVPLRHF